MWPPATCSHIGLDDETLGKFYISSGSDPLLIRHPSPACSFSLLRPFCQFSLLSRSRILLPTWPIVINILYNSFYFSSACGGSPAISNVTSRGLTLHSTSRNLDLSPHLLCLDRDPLLLHVLLLGRDLSCLLRLRTTSKFMYGKKDCNWMVTILGMVTILP